MLFAANDQNSLIAKVCFFAHQGYLGFGLGEVVPSLQSDEFRKNCRRLG